MAVTRADGVDFDAKYAGADLTGKVNYLGKLDTDGNVVLCTSGARVCGIITEDGVAGKPITFQNRGLGKCIAASAINEGDAVQSDGSGKAIAGTANSFGTARNAVTADGEIVEVQIDQRGA